MTLMSGVKDDKEIKLREVTMNARTMREGKETHSSLEERGTDKSILKQTS